MSEQIEIVGRPSGAPGNADTVAVEDPRAGLARLKAWQDGHPFWTNRFFKACKAGHLNREDFRFAFSQYYLYSRDFTRYLAGLMATTESDFYRARLSENLWEEGGGASPEKRHAEIFRGFLRDGLGLDLGEIEYKDYTRYFCGEYLNACRTGSAVSSSAFLSLGTESIVPRMYGILLEGLTQAGIADEHLEFFRLHIACDDAHSETLEEMLLSQAGQPGWYYTSLEATERALSLRMRFFENLYETIERNRTETIFARIQARKPLTGERPQASELLYRWDHQGTPLYSNVNERLGIDFAVERLPFGAEVLDPRIVKIPRGKFNEKHRHAHETVFYFVQGSGYVEIEKSRIEVKAGDVVFVPRWAMHQSANNGDEEMVILAITDFGLTGKAFVGDYEKTARMKRGPVGGDRD